MMTYQQAQQYLDPFINYEKLNTYPYKQSFKLERMQDFLKLLGEPQKDLRSIHIAGTKGKGSTCAFVAYILKEAGFKVGLYTSPHLSNFRERIRILKYQSSAINHQHQDDFEGIIEEGEVADLVERLRPVIEKFSTNNPYGPLSFFEIYTAMAFMYFKDKRVDFAILETGLGGRLDATNVVDALCLGITPISYEHTQKLGSNLSEIALEKCGIIRNNNSIVLSAPQGYEVEAVIKNHCLKKSSRLYTVGKDIMFKPIKSIYKKQIFSISGLFADYPNLEIGLIGRHQLINASLALSMVEALRFHNIFINEQSIRDGLKKTLWPGRLEVIRNQPKVILDGAQNVASASALKQAIRENFDYRKLILILGISKDKDIKGVGRELEEIADEFVFTQANNPRAQEPQAIKDTIHTTKAVSLTYNVKQAIELALEKATRDDLILITGSLFVVGEAREIFKTYETR